MIKIKMTDEEITELGEVFHDVNVAKASFREASELLELASRRAGKAVKELYPNVTNIIHPPGEDWFAIVSDDKEEGEENGE